MKFGFAAVALLLTTSGCTMTQEGMGARAERHDREAAQAQTASAQEVTLEQNGSTIRLPAGGQLTVALAGNRTTGYAWEVASTPANLTAGSSEYVEDAHAPGMVGAGGTEKFTFRAARAGQGQLRLQQVGAGGRGVAATFAVTVVVG